ncbi:unnamed protein product [Effrenium voratum]|nr:unnamed protein product [Effrenium voratum]
MPWGWEPLQDRLSPRRLPASAPLTFSDSRASDSRAGLAGYPLVPSTASSMPASPDSSLAELERRAERQRDAEIRTMEAKQRNLESELQELRAARPSDLSLAAELRQRVAQVQAMEAKQRQMESELQESCELAGLLRTVWRRSCGGWSCEPAGLPRI